jgi:Uma2 family endonuclease
LEIAYFLTKKICLNRKTFTIFVTKNYFMHYVLNINQAKAQNIISDEDKFFYWLAAQGDIVIERDKNGNIIFMSPTNSKYGKYNEEVSSQLWLWNKKTKSGEVFDSSTGFELPNKAIRSPDVSWIKKERWNALTKEEKNSFAPICPDFVVELKSPHQSLKQLQEKMEEYRENGAQLGWLIDMEEEVVYIYEQNKEVKQVKGLKGKLSAEPYLPGFALDLDELKQLKEEDELKNI